MKIYSVFNSIDGEVNPYGQGAFSTFIRFAGCNLNCKWCDTKYAQDPDSGREWTVDEILIQLNKIGCNKVTITGGEPLLQMKDFAQLTNKLWHNGYRMTVETNGSLSLYGYGVESWIVDYKLPSSGEMDKMNHKMFADLRINDFVKFVIMDADDYRIAMEKVLALKICGCRAKMVFSPCAGKTDHKVLMNWLQKDKAYNIQLNFQLHKLVDLEEPA